MNEEARTPVKTPALPERAVTVYRKLPIVVEGVDCSGKTTFCKWLAYELIDRKVNVEFYHHGPLRTSVYEEYVKPLTETSIYPTVLLADRWHLGEMVYGPLYRGKSEMSDVELDEIEGLLNIRDAKKILLDIPTGEVLRRMKARGEDFLKEEDLGKAIATYELLAGKHGYEVFRNPCYGDAVKIAKEAADECARHSVRVR